MQSARPADKGPGDSGMTYTHAMLNGAVYCYHGYGRDTYVAPDGRAWTRYDGVEKLWRATAKGSQSYPYNEIRKILEEIQPRSERSESSSSDSESLEELQSRSVSSGASTNCERSESSSSDSE